MCLRHSLTGYLFITFLGGLPVLPSASCLPSTMASDGPDPQSLKSWQDAFQYPIPSVRRVEQELRRDIASNKEKLRALVGYVALKCELLVHQLT
jgi:hypothetical protein